MRTINILLLLVAIAGAVMAFRQQGRTAVLKTEYERLIKKAGPVEISGQKFHVIRYDEKDNKVFRFRYSAPVGINLHHRASGSSFVARHDNLVSDENEELDFFFLFLESEILASVHFESGMSVHTIGKKKTGEFLREHWDQLEFNICGNGSQSNFARDEIVKVLEIRMPQKLIDANEPDKFGSIGYRFQKYPVFRYELGTASSMNGETTSSTKPATPPTPSDSRTSD